MLSLLLKYGKKVLTLLLMAFILVTGNASAEEREVIRLPFINPPVIEQTLSTHAIRSCDVIIRVGEYDGKPGKRIYVNEGISWKDIPRDIPIHKDNNGYYIAEYDINKKVAEKLVNALRANGVNAQMQIANGRKEDLNTAGRISNRSNPKLYISIHHNSYQSDSSGYFTMCNENNIKAFIIANRLNNCLKDNGLVPQRAVRYNDGYIGELNVIHDSTIGVLLELGFYSNLEELKIICSDDYTDYVSSRLSAEIQNILNDYWG
jgi:hypothetical protein